MRSNLFPLRAHQVQLVFLILIALHIPNKQALAQVSASTQELAPTETKISRAAQEKIWSNCADGYYTGYRYGRRNYTMDKYLWTVTPDFAKRFCMPPEMVSTELKGAEAIAFRMVDGGFFDQCDVDDEGTPRCSENTTVRLEIYLPQSLNLPAANPQVQFFERRASSSASQFGRIEHVTKDFTKITERYLREKYLFGPGETPRFSDPLVNPGSGYHFSLIDSGGALSRWPAASLQEAGFRGNWGGGLDLLIFQSPILGLSTGTALIRQLDAVIRRSLGKPERPPMIVMSHSGDRRRIEERRVPEDYVHVIFLPKQFSERIWAEASSVGGNFPDLIKRMQRR